MPQRCGRPEILLTLLTAVLSACADDLCASLPPTLELHLARGSSMGAQSLVLSLDIDGTRHRRIFEVGSSLDDGATSLVVRLEPPPTAPYDVIWSAEAYASPAAQGPRIAEATGQFRGTQDGCNRFELSLGPVGGARDGGVLDSGPASDAEVTQPDGGSPAFPYSPSNFDSARFTVGPDVTLACGGTVTLDTTTGSLQGGCGPPPTLVAPEPMGEPLFFVVNDFVLPAGTELRVVGARPLVFVAFGRVEIAGVLDVGARGATAGAGGSPSEGCPAAAAVSGDLGGEGGGGGGGFGGPGQAGGASAAGPGGAGGPSTGEAPLIPLRGGCPGGEGGDRGGVGAVGGAGGGAVQISARGVLSVTGSILAGGGGGEGGVRREGAGGGGSGGAILLEAPDIELGPASVLAANGGGGGEGGAEAAGARGASGGDGGRAGGTGGSGASAQAGDGGRGQDGAQPGAPGGAATVGQSGGGGGGGGGGRIRLNAVDRCERRGAVTPAETGNSACS